MRAQDVFVAKLMRTKQRAQARKPKRTNYVRGAEIERRIVNAARAKGQIAGRTAGSHSPIDIFIIDEKEETIVFVQSKRSKDGRFPTVASPFREGLYWVRFKQINYRDGHGVVDGAAPEAKRETERA